ncbi:nitroreductase [Halobacillus salinarum]|uniref:Nitroreductase n=1 Tax=Halobacillus salinarum TaxID=2932257 RepID=A0ABY4EQC9_9BACI|nr:nitroreductase [Halobacillus salinarum]UOQ45872.1 nitroreductase [Halobacillus salinarum]
MNLRQGIKNRRSIHDFKSEKVSEEMLTEIFSTASWAPNHRMKEPWNIRIFQEDGKKDYADLVIESYERAGFFAAYNDGKKQKMIEGIRNFLVSIPHHALIFMEREQDPHKFEEDYAAVCAFIQNAQLGAWEMGVGMLWTTSPYLNDEWFAEGLGIDFNRYKPVAVLQMGFPNQVPAAKKRSSITEKMKFVNNRFKEKS